MGFFNSKKEQRRKELSEKAKGLGMTPDEIASHRVDDIFESLLNQREKMVNKHGLKHAVYSDKIDRLTSVLNTFCNNATASVVHWRAFLYKEESKESMELLESGAEEIVNHSLRRLIATKGTIDGYKDAEYLEELNLLEGIFFDDIEKPENEKQEYLFQNLHNLFVSTVNKVVWHKLQHELELYFRKEAAKYNISEFWPMHPLLARKQTSEEKLEADYKNLTNEIIKGAGGENGTKKHIYCVRIRSNIDNKQYVRIGVSDKGSEDANNDVVDVTEVYLDTVLEPDIALALQKGVLKYYKPLNHNLDEYFDEFERFEGYTEIIPMEHRSSACQDIQKVAENVDDIRFIFESLSFLYKTKGES